MNVKLQKTLLAASVLCIILAAIGCGGKSAARMTAPAAVEIKDFAKTPEYVVFNGRNINLNEYISLISLCEQLSFENIIIENDSDFIEAAKQYNLEHLYSLYEYINSLSSAEAGELSGIIFEELNNS